MSVEPKKVWVVGHKNPDTDSVCAAISYAYLKNQIGTRSYAAKRAGAINEETRYVLDYFGVEEPELVTYAGAQIKDISIRKTAGVSSQISLKRAWELMKKLEVVTLPVTNQMGKVEGIIVTKDIATSYMDVLDNRALSQARTQYKTIAETLEGAVYAGNEHAFFIRGKVVVATSNNEYMADYIEDDDLVILGDREEAQMQAIRSNASCIVIGGGLEVGEEVKSLAERRDCVIITTPFDTFSVARLINQSMPIKQYMTRAELVTFDIDDYVDDVKEVMSKVRHRDFPVLGENGKYDLNPETGAQMLGDVVISVPQAVRQAQEYDHSFQREMAFLTVHSMLHLLGYDHVDGGIEAVKMREKEEHVLSQLGVPRNASYYMED